MNLKHIKKGIRKVITSTYSLKKYFKDVNV